MPQLTRDTLRIVHVDDDGDFTELSARGLKRAGFRQPIVRCKDGRLAVDYFSAIQPKTSPHVIILDLHMLRMDGLEVLHWVRRNYSQRDVAVYLLTSSEDPAHRRQAAADRVTEFLSKGLLTGNLIEKLDRLIGVINAKGEQDGGNEYEPIVAEGLASFSPPMA